MKKLLLERLPTTPTHTEGFLSFAGAVLCTIERPWIEGDTPGGKPFESCVPAGVYKLRAHTRPDGKHVLALINESLGVYYLETDMPVEGGRFLILIHIANWVHNVVGCIGPGWWKTDSAKGRMVKSSGSAMKKIMKYVGDDEAEIEIKWITEE